MNEERRYMEGILSMRLNVILNEECTFWLDKQARAIRRTSRRSREPQ